MASELQHTLTELGGAAGLGRRIRSGGDMQAAIREGFPQAALLQVMERSSLTLKEIAESLDLSPRSLQRRRDGRLAPAESDRLYRLARMIGLARFHVGDDQSALRWLKQKNPALGGRAPLACLDTEPGAREVENVLGRIAYGGVS